MKVPEKGRATGLLLCGLDGGFSWKLAATMTYSPPPDLKRRCEKPSGSGSRCPTSNDQRRNAGAAAAAAADHS